MKNRLLILSLLVSVPAFAWQPQTGDIIFQISRSSQSKAIQLATHTDYSHTGMLVIRNKKPYVFEAVGPVKYTPLKQWIAHGEKGKYVVRRVEGGLSVEQQQKTGANGKNVISVNRMISASHGATIASTVRKWCGRFTRTRWECAWASSRS
ncbi:putative peptidoglycan peptidase [Escherichia coli]|nr:putative peptidoglycan peptidase [Escherichia coli]